MSCTSFYLGLYNLSLSIVKRLGKYLETFIYNMEKKVLELSIPYPGTSHCLAPSPATLFRHLNHFVSHLRHTSFERLFLAPQSAHSFKRSSTDCSTSPRLFCNCGSSRQPPPSIGMKDAWSIHCASLRRCVKN